MLRIPPHTKPEFEASWVPGLREKTAFSTKFPTLRKVWSAQVAEEKHADLDLNASWPSTSSMSNSSIYLKTFCSFSNHMQAPSRNFRSKTTTLALLQGRDIECLFELQTWALSVAVVCMAIAYMKSMCIKTQQQNLDSCNPIRCFQAHPPRGRTKRGGKPIKGEALLFILLTAQNGRSCLKCLAFKILH